MEVDENYVEFIGLLNAEQVRYLVVGGYAVNYHGYPRYTGDIDIWLWLDPDNIERAIACIRRFGFGALGIDASDLTASNKVLQLGYEPVRIDLLTTVDGVDFEACYRNRSLVELGPVDAPFLSLDDLLTAKRATGRPQDLADVAALNRLRDAPR